MSQINIRDFIPEDRTEYLRLSQNFYTSQAVTHSIPENNFSRTFDQCLAQSPYLRGLALTLDNIFAGYALLSFTWSNEAGGLVLLLEEAYIDPAHQGTGLGSALLKFIENDRQNIKRIRLEVTPGNQAAIRLYERNGYAMLDYLQMIKDL